MAAMLQAIPIVARGGGKKWLGTFQKRQAVERITQNLKKPGTTRSPGLTRRPNGQPGRRRRTTGLDLIASSHLAGSQFLTRIFLDSAPDFAQYSLYRNRWAKSLLQTVLRK